MCYIHLVHTLISDDCSVNRKSFTQYRQQLSQHSVLTGITANYISAVYGAKNDVTCQRHLETNLALKDEHFSNV